MTRICHRGIVLLASAGLLLACLHAMEKPRSAKAGPVTADSVKTEPVKVKQLAELPVAPPVGVKYQSQGRRDPFLSPLGSKKAQKPADEEVLRGARPPGIGGMFIDQVALLGIVSQDGDQTAIFRGTDSRAYFLHEGDKLYDGSVTKIGADAVSMTRETRYRSGKVLRQEVTKRLRPL